MSITRAAAHAATQAAFSTGNQVTVTMNDGSVYIGTPRWNISEVPSHTLWLFGTLLHEFVNGGGPVKDISKVTNSGSTSYLTLGPYAAPIPLDQIASIATASATADTTLGTVINEFGFPVADVGWLFGTGAE